MISLDDAQRIVLDQAELRPVSVVDILQSLGGTIAEDIRADRDQPPFDRSAMDGYAVNSADLTGPATLRLHPEVIAAGTWPELALERGHAAKIMTGAPLPPGADAVQVVEESREVEGAVELMRGVEKGENVRYRGEEIREGDVAVPAGTRVTPAVLGVLASFGLRTVRMYDPPTVGVLTTGTELVDYTETPGPSQIRNSNSLALLGLLQNDCIAGGYLGRVSDDLAKISEAISKGICGADIVLVTGGASAGDFDFVETALKRIGAEIFFDSVAIKPGKPVTFAKLGPKTIFSLPGNPVSAIVAYLLIVQPYIKKITGCRRPLPASARALLGARHKKKGPRRHFVAGTATRIERRYVATPIESTGSSDVVGFARADCLIEFPEGEVTIEAGGEVTIYRLEDPRG